MTWLDKNFIHYFFSYFKFMLTLCAYFDFLRNNVKRKKNKRPNILYCLQQGGEHQKSVQQLVSAQVVACLAVITLIKYCYQNLETTWQIKHFFTLSGPTGSLNTKVLFKEYKLFAYLCIPTDIELCYRLLLRLHSIIAVSVHPSLLNSWGQDSHLTLFSTPKI